MTECVKIRCDDCKFVEDCVDYGWDGCKKFTPKPSEPMTNEEWFCTLPTEEKAKTIVCLEVNALHKWKKGLVKSDVDEIKRWLKEKHE